MKVLILRNIFFWNKSCGTVINIGLERGTNDSQEVLAFDHLMALITVKGKEGKRKHCRIKSQNSRLKNNIFDFLVVVTDQQIPEIDTEVSKCRGSHKPPTYQQTNEIKFKRTKQSQYIATTKRSRSK